MFGNLLTQLSVVLKWTLFCAVAFIVAAPSTYGSVKPDSTGVAHLAGLVVNAEDLSPIPFADIYDSGNNLIGQTDNQGYYNIRIQSTTTDAIRFQLKITKKGFQSFVQKENWANLPAPKAIFYFGLHETGKTAKPFSSLITETSNELNYPNVLLTFSEVTQQQAFNDKLEIAKTDNEHVFMQIDGDFYIVNNTGWIQINSDDDLVTVNDELVLKAKELNSKVERKDIKSMTPLNESKPAKFAVYTK